MAEDSSPLCNGQHGPFVDQHLFVSELLFHGRNDPGYPGASAYQENVVDQVRGKMDVLKNLPCELDGALNGWRDDLIESIPAQDHVHIDTVPITVLENPQDLNIGLVLGAQPDFGLFHLCFQFTEEEILRFFVLIFNKGRYIVDFMFLGSLRQDIISDKAVNVVTAKPHVTALPLLDKLPAADGQDGKVKGSAPEIEDKNCFGLIAGDIVHTKRNRRGRGLW